jgi:hypothetical protein
MMIASRRVDHLEDHYTDLARYDGIDLWRYGDR